MTTRPSGNVLKIVNVDLIIKQYIYQIIFKTFFGHLQYINLPISESQIKPYEGAHFK